MYHPDTPPGRLAAILRAANQVDHDSPTLDGWSRVLGATDQDLLARVLGLCELIEEARAAIEATPVGEFRTFHLQAIQNVCGLQAQLLQISSRRMADYRQYTADAISARLDSASFELRRLGRCSPVLDDDQIRALLELVRALIDEVLSSTVLDQGAKLFIVRRLRDVEAALHAYKIGGFGSIAAAVAAVGSGCLVTDGPQCGFFMGIFSRLFGATARHAPQVKEIADSATSVIGVIEAAQNVLS